MMENSKETEYLRLKEIGSKIIVTERKENKLADKSKADWWKNNESKCLTNS